MTRLLSNQVRLLGPDVFIGQSNDVGPDFATLYPADEHEGAMLYANGVIYYSDGAEWLEPVERPAIDRPMVLTPTSEAERGQVRLSPFYSEPGETQTAVIFEVYANRTDDVPLFTRTVVSTSASSYQIVSADGLSGGQQFWVTGRYQGTNGTESKSAVRVLQTYPEQIAKPELQFEDGAVIVTAEVSAFESAFNFAFDRTEWEVYSDEALTSLIYYDLNTNAGTATTFAIPDTLTPGDTYYLRARYRGYDSAAAQFGSSPYSDVQSFVMPDLASKVTIDTTNLTGSTTYGIRLNDPVGVVVDWGDGTTTTVTSGAGVQDVSRTYAADGTYTVSVSGECAHIQFGDNGGAADAVTACTSIGFGHGDGFSPDFMFIGCANLVSVPATIPPGAKGLRQTFMDCTLFNDPSILTWDVSQCTDMNRAFSGCPVFNQPIGDHWDTSSVKDFANFLENCVAFNQPMAALNTSSATSLAGFFLGAVIFNQPIGPWDTSNVTRFDRMLQGALAFNQDLGDWNVSSGQDFSFMFFGAEAFNNGGSPRIGNWTFSNDPAVNITFAQMFRGAVAFNQPIGGWNTTRVTTMGQMFELASAFNQAIGGWDTSSVTNMNKMFHYAVAFNQPIGGWNTSGVTDINRMFNAATAFDQDIGAWDVSNVTNMEMALGGDAFNSVLPGVIQTSFNNGGSPSIGNWDVSSVTNMQKMFADNRAFNQPIGNWNTASLQEIRQMFRSADAFDQDIGAWDVSSVTTTNSGLFAPGLSTANYNALLIGWEAQAVQDGVAINVSGTKYSAGAAADARAALIADHGWTIVDGGLAT